MSNTPSSTDSPAAALARLRWAGTTAAQRKKHMDALRSMQTMTAEERSERARKAAKASAAVGSAAAKKKNSAERKSNAGKAIRNKPKKSVKK